jgi:antitoxin component of MazEF toxin-antitoxin module
MGKKVFAVTNIKIGQAEDEFFAAGGEVDPKKFTMEQLKALHDEGAVEIRVVEDEVMTEPEATEATEEAPAETAEEAAEEAAEETAEETAEEAAAEPTE